MVHASPGEQLAQVAAASLDRPCAEAFAFEIVERLEDEAIDYVRSRLLKARLLRWTDELQAVRI